MKFLRQGLTISLLTQAHSIADLPFNITASGPFSISQIGIALSAMVATVEDVFLVLNPALSFRLSFRDVAPWCEFFSQLRSVKILRVYRAVAVADVLRLGQGGSSQSVSDILPSLEEIEIQLSSQDTLISESKRAFGLNMFGPFVIARQKMGCPAKVYYNTDRVLPKYFYDPNE